ncbi:hypothetical protein KC340_g3087 [Hortaea werneckii]|nr:hypothetical protein KC342_g3342 [Hortaea werneckii]KAI7106782.1 hypothetical protein KC339_g2849 [Hortaea werneckii]KAI7207072.1 hypothetical protein KC365_g16765 [Hortaea werneckii]KAI7333089.1 hypothetical protein KC340_g3087 [Hortaea werneckii]KAI7394022.1 hypothetical protein KC328_g6332 [Hortaea werneckii]
MPRPERVEKALVMGKVAGEEVGWAHELRPDWTPYIYSASVPPEPGYPLTLPIQRGREAGVYLSFIVDHYPNFPAYTVFLHASDHHWHNDDALGPSTPTTLANLRLDTVEREGYVNLRCNHNPGCPVSINPLSPTQTDIETGDPRSFFADMYQEVLNVTAREQVPEHLGVACCSQFAVTRARILARPWEDYVRMREWALRGSDYADGRMNSYGVGWVFESLWHVIFGKEAVFCPEEGRCRCDLYGVC